MQSINMENKHIPFLYFFDDELRQRIRNVCIFIHDYKPNLTTNKNVQTRYKHKAKDNKQNCLTQCILHLMIKIKVSRHTIFLYFQGCARKVGIVKKDNLIARTNHI